jgi:hypothetical protein
MANRIARFGDNGDLISNLNVDVQERPYFGGLFSDQRMNQIRKSIEEVRGKWQEYQEIPVFIHEFLRGIDHPEKSSKIDRLTARINSSLQRNRHWADRRPSNSSHTDFPLIQLYSSVDGYELLFGKINYHYRNLEPSESYRKFVPLTWFVELLTMELFAASIAYPNLTGTKTVYRGTTFQSDLLPYYEIFGSESLPLDKRSISIPLGFHSASTDKRVAFDFLRLNDTRKSKRDNGHFGVIWSINVVSLSEKRLNLYHERYPKSVVSSICATDISQFSEHQEKEVLLRGPFFEAVDWRQVEDFDGMPMYEVEAVMVDSNRDHISTFELDKRDYEARAFFRSLVSWEKRLACAELSESLGKNTLSKEYRAAAAEAEKEVELAKGIG